MAINWERVTCKLDTGETVSAIAPVIISASRATDIPAFYAPWFMQQLKKGYCTWKNPFNSTIQYISFSKLSAIVFWTKNPEPMFPFLETLNQMGYAYYFLYSLNDYEQEHYERNVPEIANRIANFKRLSSLIGKGRVLWRFDPLLLSHKISPVELQKRVAQLGDELVGYTDKLIFSFIDIAKYRKVVRNTKLADATIREFTLTEKYEFASFLSEAQQRWRLQNADFAIASCAQELSLESFGIAANKCIDDAVFRMHFPENTQLMHFLGYEHTIFGLEKNASVRLKDTGQRKACRCIVSKDIGTYNTCPHGCVYCYANASFPGDRIGEGQQDSK